MIQIFNNKEIPAFLEKYNSRSADVSDTVRQAVSQILSDVRNRGDAAVAEYTKKFDGADLSEIPVRVSQKEIEEAAASMDPTFLEILKQSASNIRKFHEKGKTASWLTWEEDGVVLGQRITPLDRVGLYVPGGRAVYPSSLLMTAIPAQVAGVKELAIVSPPGKDGKVHPSILAAASVLGIDEIYRIGGTQAVAALAFGTEKIKAVDKIVGPGNQYVAEAKRQVFGIVDIDMIAGPSEVVVLADESADPKYVAADLLAQAEHDPEASSICVTASKSLAEAVQTEVKRQTESLNRNEIITTSLSNWGGILVADSEKEALDLVNYLAPEHLGVHTADPWATLSEIRHAGAIFLGHYAPETIGDYWAGPNHVLPTNRTARFASPLGTDDFLKKSSLISYTSQALKKNGDAVMTFAQMEGLDGHANAVRQRLD